jgi:hypothetical protein
MSRRVTLAALAFAIAFAAPGCGDDTVNPSNPDASAAKAAAPASEGGHEASTIDASSEAGNGPAAEASELGDDGSDAGS